VPLAVPMLGLVVFTGSPSQSLAEPAVVTVLSLASLCIWTAVAVEVSVRMTVSGAGSAPDGRLGSGSQVPVTVASRLAEALTDSGVMEFSSAPLPTLGRVMPISAIGCPGGTVAFPSTEPGAVQLWGVFLIPLAEAVAVPEPVQESSQLPAWALVTGDRSAADRARKARAWDRGQGLGQRPGPGTEARAWDRHTIGRRGRCASDNLQSTTGSGKGMGVLLRPGRFCALRRSGLRGRRSMSPDRRSAG
jgi:hypothetical protein